MYRYRWLLWYLDRYVRSCWRTITVITDDFACFVNINCFGKSRAFFVFARDRVITSRVNKRFVRTATQSPCIGTLFTNSVGQVKYFVGCRISDQAFVWIALINERFSGRIVFMRISMLMCISTSECSEPRKNWPRRNWMLSREAVSQDSASVISPGVSGYLLRKILSDFNPFNKITENKKILRVEI